MKRALLIGAGGRAKTVILPALHCMRELLSLEAVVTRSVRPMSLFGGKMNFTTLSTLRNFDLSTLDYIIVATTLDAVPGIIHDLTRRSVGHVTLLLDTPVLPRRRCGAARRFSLFKAVLVSEDCIALPPYVAAKQLIDSGRIGRVSRIYSFHNDYKYHALSSMKYLTDSCHIRSIRCRAAGANVMEAVVRMPSGPTVWMLEPRDYGVGRFLIVGERGFICDYPLKGARGIHIGYRFEGGNYRGLAIDGEPCPDDDLDRRFLANLPEEREDHSLRTTLKIRAFMSLLDGATNPLSPFRYSPEAGLYDMAAIACTERFRRFYDVGLGRQSAMASILRLLCRLGPS
jgi:hypothetical protein